MDKATSGLCLLLPASVGPVQVLTFHRHKQSSQRSFGEYSYLRGRVGAKALPKQQLSAHPVPTQDSMAASVSAATALFGNHLPVLLAPGLRFTRLYIISI